MSYSIKHLFHIKLVDDCIDALTDIQKLQKWYTTETQVAPNKWQYQF